MSKTENHPMCIQPDDGPTPNEARILELEAELANMQEEKKVRDEFITELEIRVNRANDCVADIYDRFKEVRRDRNKWKARAESLLPRV